MELIREGLEYILSFEVYVMLPILMFIVCMIVRIRVMDAFKYSMTLGIGFLGIFMVFDFFIAQMGPAIERIAERQGSQMAILDVGWPPLAACAWTFPAVPIIILLIVAINILMIFMKLTNTINIDIWNFWHFIFAGQMVYYVTQNMMLAIVASLVTMVVILKIGDWSAERVEHMSHIPGITITTLSGIAYYPIALVMDKIIDHIPVLKKIDGNPQHIQEKLGFAGDPRFIGFFMGGAIGLFAGYSVKDAATLAISVAGVVYIMPKMAGILGDGLIPISNGAKAFIIRKSPRLAHARIGMDLAVIIGLPEVIVTGIIVMPIAVVLALVLPGISFIPLGDLPNLIPVAALIVIATRGNIFRAVIAYIPIIIGKLYISTNLSSLYTTIAVDNNIDIKGFAGNITSFQDGGNLLRGYIFYIFTGQRWALFMLPVVIGLLIYTYSVYCKESQGENSR